MIDFTRWRLTRRARSAASRCSRVRARRGCGRELPETLGGLLALLARRGYAPEVRGTGTGWCVVVRRGEVIAQGGWADIARLRVEVCRFIRREDRLVASHTLRILT